MDSIGLLGSALGLGFLAGIRLYATVLALGLAVRFHLLDAGQEVAAAFGDRIRRQKRQDQGRDLEDVRQQDMFGAIRVADYLLDKDQLFARVTLDDAEYGLYERVYSRVVVDAPKPDLVVYLQAPLDVLMDRIAKRGIRYEQYLERSYLEKLMQAYARFFHSYDVAPLLIVNSAAIDPVNNEDDYQVLLTEILKARRGRHFFNPAGRSLLTNI